MSVKDDIDNAEIGTEIVYNVGVHCVGVDGRRTKPARDAWDAYTAGKVVLYQRRRPDGQLDYVAKVIR